MEASHIWKRKKKKSKSFYIGMDDVNSNKMREKKGQITKRKL